MVELIAILFSTRFAMWFLTLVDAILRVSAPVVVALIGVIAVADIAFGVGALVGNAWAFCGMILPQ